MGSRIETSLTAYRIEEGEDKSITDAEIDDQVEGLMQKIWFMGRRLGDL